MRSEQNRRQVRPLHLEVLEDRYLLSTYVVTDLGTDFTGQAMNNLGQVAGSMFDHAMLWDSGKFTDLGTLGGARSAAMGINDAGQVVGWSDVMPGDPYTRHPFVWDSTNGMQDLGTFGGYFSSAMAINNAGQIAIAGGNGHGFLLTDGAAIDLCPGDRVSCFPLTINSAGQMAGGSTQIAGDLHATFWDATGAAVDVGTLPPDETSTAYGINDAAQVVGQSEGSFRAFLWQDGAIHDLLNGRYSGASGINNAGQVVGFATGSGMHSGAFVFSDGELAFLNDLVPPETGLFLDFASKINDNGQILSRGFENPRMPHTVLLTPDDGGAPHSRDAGMFRLPYSNEGTDPALIPSQSAPSALRQQAPMETIAALSADAGLPRAANSVFVGMRHFPPGADALASDELAI